MLPANEVDWQQLQAVFGVRGSSARCWCQRYKLPPGESFAAVAAEVRAGRLREQTDCGQPAAGATSGLVAIHDDGSVGWCAVEPRPAFTGLVRNFRVPWDGRAEDRDDVAVWAITCVLVRTGWRRRGVGTALVQAAVDHARVQGAAAVEGYPMTTTAAIAEEMHVGTESMFAAAGLRVVSRPTLRRVVMRRDFDQTGPA